jgi:hypothetical protein
MIDKSVAIWFATNAIASRRQAQWFNTKASIFVDEISPLLTILAELSKFS